MGNGRFSWQFYPRALPTLGDSQFEKATPSNSVIIASKLLLLSFLFTWYIAINPFLIHAIGPQCRIWPYCLLRWSHCPTNTIAEKRWSNLYMTVIVVSYCLSWRHSDKWYELWRGFNFGPNCPKIMDYSRGFLAIFAIFELCFLGLGGSMAHY